MKLFIDICLALFIIGCGLMMYSCFKIASINSRRDERYYKHKYEE